jgi:ankyrin repeat protein
MFNPFHYFIANRNINAQDNNGYTPLHIAAGNNQVAIANLLLNKGASATILDNDGHTAKQVAAFLGYTDMASLLP